MTRPRPDWTGVEIRPTQHAAHAALGAALGAYRLWLVSTFRRDAALLDERGIDWLAANRSDPLGHRLAMAAAQARGGKHDPGRYERAVRGAEWVRAWCEIAMKERT